MDSVSNHIIMIKKNVTKHIATANTVLKPEPNKQAKFEIKYT